MSCKTLLAPLLMAFGFVLGAPALGDDVSSDSGAATGVWIDAIVVGAPSNDMTLCLRLNSGCANLPCVISADGATLACVTLAPGDNYFLVPTPEPDAVVTVMPDNDGLN